MLLWVLNLDFAASEAGAPAAAERILDDGFLVNVTRLMGTR